MAERASVLDLLQPRSIAIVGASNDVHKLRGRLLKTLLACGFDGPIYPISRTSDIVQGVRAYPSLSAVGAPVDLVMIAVPAAHVAAALDDCERLGVKAVIVHTASDAENDLSSLIREYSARTGVPVLGPNTEGVYGVVDHVAANFTPVLDPSLLTPESDRDRDDRISLVSQSGGLGFGFYGEAVRAGVGFRHVVITGAEASIDLLDAVDALVADGRARAIVIFAEGFKEPQKFARVAARAARASIPVLAIKIGKSDAGKRAAISHSGTLAGADTAYDAMFDRYGVVRAADPESAVAAASILSLPKQPKGPRVGLVTTTGGTGGWASDLCSAAGLEVPALSPELQRQLAAIIPEYGATGNPVDVTADALQDGGEAFVRAIGAVAESGEVDAVVAMANLTMPGRIASMAPLLAPLIEALNIPLVIVSSTPAAPSNIEASRQLGAAYATLRGAAIGLESALRYQRFLARCEPVSACTDRVQRRWPETAPVAELLQHYGVTTAPETVAASPDEAVTFANQVGYPVVAKIASPDIPHKTEAKAVVLNVGSEEELRTAFANVVANAVGYKPGARLGGVQIQKMMDTGIELVLGMTRDPDFGPLLMLGFGGVYIDVLSDVVFQPVPVGPGDARRMISSLRGAKLLEGVRGEAGADIDALVDLIVRVSELVEDAGEELLELDLNPVAVYPPGEGYAVLDALLVRKGGN